VPFESLGVVSYSPFIVTMAESVAVCEIFSVKEWRWSLKMVPFHRPHANWSNWSAIVNTAISVAICDIFSMKEWCDTENRVRVRSKSLEMSPFDRPHTSSYSPSIVTIALSCIVCEI